MQDIGRSKRAARSFSLDDVAIMKPLGLVEVCRTGIAAMNRGPQGM